MTKRETDQLRQRVFIDVMTALGAVFAIWWRWSYGDVAGFLMLLIVWDLAATWIGVKMRARRERLALHPRTVVH